MWSKSLKTIPKKEEKNQENQRRKKRLQYLRKRKRYIHVEKQETK
jgi:hypothetical protein